MNYVQKDIIQALKDGDIDVLAHQCNCVTGNTVKGVAKKIYDLVENKEFFSKEPFGVNKIIHFNDYQLIINVYAQYYPGPPSLKEIPKENIFNKFPLNVNKDTFDTRILVWILFFNTLRKTNNSAIKIGIPLIMSGLAREAGYSDITALEYFKLRVEPVLKSFVEGLNLTVYYL